MFKKIILFIVLIIAVACIGFLAFQFKESGKTAETQKFTLNPQNCSYAIEGENVNLINGYSEKEVAPGSTSKIITKYFGNEVAGDFNNDGISDIAFVLTQNSGGSGTFYYLAVALGGEDKCNGTNAILLGDRIAPQTVNFINGEIVANYAERKPDEPMTAMPSVGVSRYFKINESQLIEIIK